MPRALPVTKAAEHDLCLSEHSVSLGVVVCPLFHEMLVSNNVAREAFNITAPGAENRGAKYKRRDPILAKSPTSRAIVAISHKELSR